MVALPMAVLHTPPVAELVYNVVLPWQKSDGPRIVPATGSVVAVTVATVVTKQLPDVYDISDVPAAIAVKMPVAASIVPVVGVPLLHAPPGVASLSVVDAPAQMV